MSKKTDKMLTDSMNELMVMSLAVRGHSGLARYMGDEIHMTFILDDGVHMDLYFDADTTPVAAVERACGILDKLNGK